MKPLYSYTKIYVDEALKLGLDHKILVPPALVEIYNQDQSTRINQTKTELNHGVATSTCRNKRLTYLVLKKHNIPLPKQYSANSVDQALNYSKQLKFPIVAKPKKESFGRGVILNISNKTELKKASNLLLKKYPSFLLEEQCFGEDYRIVVLDHQVIGLVKREPPFIIGDGKSTIESLASSIKKFRIDQESNLVLSSQGYTLSSVPPRDTKVQLRYNANGSSGGFSTTLPNDHLHPKITELVIQISKALNITLVGLDLLIKDPSKPPKNNVVLIEANSAPGLGVHYNPTHGSVQPIAKKVLQKIFNLK